MVQKGIVKLEGAEWGADLFAHATQLKQASRFRSGVAGEYCSVCGAGQFPRSSRFNADFSRHV